MYLTEQKTSTFYLFPFILICSVSACSAINKSDQQIIQVDQKTNHSVVTKSTISVASYDTRKDGAVRVTDCKGHSSCQNAVFSESGTEIIFTRFLNGYNEGPSEIIRLNLATLKEVKVIPASEYDHVNVPGSSWKNGLLTYASDHAETEHEEIFVCDSSGKNIKQITSHEDNSLFFEPSFSEKGNHIVFEKSACSSQYSKKQCEKYDLGRGGLWLIDLATSQLTILLSDNDIDFRLPNWSPAGDKILFQQREYPSKAREEPDWDIWTISVDGGDKKNITHSRKWHETDASWSYDGRYIVYSSDYGDIGQPNIFMITANGGEPKRMTFSSANEDGAPSFSPDSKYIAFESHKTDDEDSASNIWIIKSSHF